MKKLTLIATTIASLAMLGSAQAYNIDGDLNDWLDHKPDNRLASDWDPLSGVNAYTVEDWDGHCYSGTDGRCFGGQKYDAEAMYLDWDNNNLYIAIVTGTPPDNYNYGPGDIAINFGGVPGNPLDFKYGIDTTGSTGNYAGSLINNNSFTVGGLYTNIQWGDGLNTWGGITDPTSILSGDLIGTGLLAYNTATYNGGYPQINMGEYGCCEGDPYNEHYMIEASIPISAFGGDWDTVNGTSISVHWTQNCGNDAIDLTANIDGSGSPPAAPEPMSLALMGIGLLGFGAQRLKKRK